MKERPSWTTKLRVWWSVMLSAVVVCGLYGWLKMDKDLGDLTPLLTTMAAAAAIGEASNVGKRATWKAEAAQHQERQ